MSADDAERELGATVRAARVSKRWTRDQLAERANLSVGAVRNLETGAGSTVTTLVRVVRALGADSWLTALTPTPVFSPLAVVEQTRAEPRPPQRVRARRSARAD